MLFLTACSVHLRRRACGSFSLAMVSTVDDWRSAVNCRLVKVCTSCLRNVKNETSV